MHCLGGVGSRYEERYQRHQRRALHHLGMRVLSDFGPLVAGKSRLEIRVRLLRPFQGVLLSKI